MARAANPASHSARADADDADQGTPPRQLGRRQPLEPAQYLGAEALPR